MSSVTLKGLPGGRLSSHSVAKQVPYALSLALNRTAYSARDQARARFARVLRNKRPSTLNSPRVTRATKASLTARVYVNDDVAKGTSPAKYLRALELGGPRRFKRFEQALHYGGVIEPYEFVIPFDGGTLDQRGNAASVGGVYQQMLTVLRSSRAGEQNETVKSLFRKSRRGRRPVRYFKSGDYIWEYGASGTSAARPILAIVQRAPTYQPILGFRDTVERVVRDEARWWWDDALRTALATAR